MGSYINSSDYNRLFSDSYNLPFLRKYFKMLLAITLLCM